MLALVLLVTDPPLTRTTPSVPEIDPLFVTEPAAPVTKAPDPLPVSVPVEALVRLPPAPRSTAAPPVPVALMLPAFVTDPKAPTM